MQLNHCHLQLTQACNLNCHFCGQNHVAAGELTAAEWFDLLAQMAELPVLPKLTVWGGEPLLSPIFPAVAEKAAAMGFSMELITNGTLLDRYSSLIKNNFRRVCVSVDGPEDIHDAIRGKGVFRKLSRNLPLISGGNATVEMMGVLAPETLATVSQAPYGLPVDGIIFHELIYMTADEAGSDAAAWENNYSKDYPAKLAATVRELRNVEFPVPAQFQPHGTGNICQQIYTHLHIGSTGETSFCTDFTGYTLGNVRERSLLDIFNGEAANVQRKKVEAGTFPCCRHCSWCNTAADIIKFENKK